MMAETGYAVRKHRASITARRAVSVGVAMMDGAACAMRRLCEAGTVSAAEVAAVTGAAYAARGRRVPMAAGYAS